MSSKQYVYIYRDLMHKTFPFTEMTGDDLVNIYLIKLA